MVTNLEGVLCTVVQIIGKDLEFNNAALAAAEDKMSKGDKTDRVKESLQRYADSAQRCRGELLALAGTLAESLKWQNEAKSKAEESDNSLKSPLQVSEIEKLAAAEVEKLSGAVCPKPEAPSVEEEAEEPVEVDSTAPETTEPELI